MLNYFDITKIQNMILLIMVVILLLTQNFHVMQCKEVGESNKQKTIQFIVCDIVILYHLNQLEQDGFTLSRLQMGLKSNDYCSCIKHRRSKWLQKTPKSGVVPLAAENFFSMHKKLFVKGNTTCTSCKKFFCENGITGLPDTT